MPYSRKNKNNNKLIIPKIEFTTIKLNNKDYKIPKYLENKLIYDSDKCELRILKKAIPNMNVEPVIFANSEILDLLMNELSELEYNLKATPSIIQTMNVSTLPSVSGSFAMPDAHSGYGFSIGGVATFDLGTDEIINKDAVICPGGVGYDINCGVRLLKTDLTTEDLKNTKSELADKLFKTVPCGVGQKSKIILNDDELKDVLLHGMNYLVNKNMCPKEDLESCEENGNIVITENELKNISKIAFNKGKDQLGTLGSGNHYLEVQYVDEIYDIEAAKVMGINKLGQICVMIHTGSRGLGYQICEDYIYKYMNLYKQNEKDKNENVNLNEKQNLKEINDLKSSTLKYEDIDSDLNDKNIPQKLLEISELVDKQLIGVPFYSEAGQEYYNSMRAAANYAFANRSMISYLTRQVFKELYPNCGEMPLVYDVCHNIAKIEEYEIKNDENNENERIKNDENNENERIKNDENNENDEDKTIKTNKIHKFIVHRKGATRAFPPHHPQVPKKYQEIGQPVIIGGSMGTCSYVLVGTDKAIEKTFGSTCHGAGRKMSRMKAKNNIPAKSVINGMKEKGIEFRIVNPKSAAEECDEAYKDVSEVVETCEQTGISRKVIKLKPLITIKG